MQMTNILNNIQNMNFQGFQMFNQMPLVNQMMPILGNKFDNIKNNKNIIRICLIFDSGEKKNINVDDEITVEELLQKCVNENNLNFENFNFFHNVSELKRNDKTKIKDFPIRNLDLIHVHEYGLVNAGIKI